jgi:hypothetical protein
VIVVLTAPSLADRVREAGGTASDAQQRTWTAAALASQQQFLSEMADKGVVATPSLRFTRVLNGFSAVADPVAVALLERSRHVAGVYPVRAAFPAAAAVTEDVAASPIPAELVGFPGRGHRRAARTAVGPATHISAIASCPARLVSGVSPRATTSAPEANGRGARPLPRARRRQGIAGGRVGSLGRDPAADPRRRLATRRFGPLVDTARTDQIAAGSSGLSIPTATAMHDARSRCPLVEPFADVRHGHSPARSRGLPRSTRWSSLRRGRRPRQAGVRQHRRPGGAPNALTVGAVDLRP